MRKGKTGRLGENGGDVDPIGEITSDGDFAKCQKMPGGRGGREQRLGICFWRNAHERAVRQGWRIEKMVFPRIQL